MSSNARKGLGGNTRRLIIRERGDLRDRLIRNADWAEAEQAFERVMARYPKIMARLAEGVSD